MAKLTETIVGAALLAASAGTCTAATTIKHVLLISIDGMHALDFLNCSAGISGVNGGPPYCPKPRRTREDGRRVSRYVHLEAVRFIPRLDGADDQWLAAHRRRVL
jgi:hypothetical protein